MNNIKQTNPTASDKHFQHQLKQLTKRKYITDLYIFGLIDLHSTNEKLYWKTYHCCSNLTKQDLYDQDGVLLNSRILTKHCKLKHCILCSQLRTSELVYSYKPTLDSWENKHFLTLTVPNCNDSRLRSTIDTMHKTLSLLTRTINQNRKRNKTGVPLRYVAHFETTFNPKSNTYHPHIHLIGFDKTDCEEILSHWLKRIPTASDKAQDLQPANENSSKELFKYFTKIISSKDSSRTVYLEALDNIFTASKGKRVFVASGVRKIKKTKQNYETFLQQLETETDQEIISTFTYRKDASVYVNDQDCTPLCNDYFPNESFKKLTLEKYTPRTAYRISIAPLAMKKLKQRKRKGKHQDKLSIAV